MAMPAAPPISNTSIGKSISWSTLSKKDFTSDAFIFARIPYKLMFLNPAQQCFPLLFTDPYAQTAQRVFTDTTLTIFGNTTVYMERDFIPHPTLPIDETWGGSTNWR